MRHPLGLTVSNAKLVEETGHGHAGALDVAPLIDSGVPWDEPGWFATLGELAERQGLEWGGRWPKPDSDHLQVPDWKQLPLGGNHA